MKTASFLLYLAAVILGVVMILHRTEQRPAEPIARRDLPRNTLLLSSGDMTLPGFGDRPAYVVAETIPKGAKITPADLSARPDLAGPAPGMALLSIDISAADLERNGMNSGKAAQVCRGAATAIAKATVRLVRCDASLVMNCRAVIEVPATAELVPVAADLAVPAKATTLRLATTCS